MLAHRADGRYQIRMIGNIVLLTEGVGAPTTENELMVDHRISDVT